MSASRSPAEGGTSNKGTSIMSRRTNVLPRDTEEGQGNEHAQYLEDTSAGNTLAMFEALAVSAATFTGVSVANKKLPNFNALPISFKALLISGPPVGWYLWSTVASSRGRANSRLPQPTQDQLENETFTQGANMTQARKNLSLAPHQRAAMWSMDHPYRATVVAAAPIIGYAGYMNYKHPTLTLTQRVLRTSVVGQVALLASLGGVMAFGSFYEKGMDQNAKTTLRKHMTRRPNSGADPGESHPERPATNGNA